MDKYLLLNRGVLQPQGMDNLKLVVAQIEKDTVISKADGSEVYVPATLSDDIITGVVREDMGFDGIEDATATVFDNISLAIAALKNQSIDCIVMDNTVAKQASESAGNEDIKVIDVVLTTENYAIAINKNDEELKQKIDKAMNELKESGKIDELFEKWEIE